MWFAEMLSTAGTRFYFSANDGIHGNELWTSDGTADGTTMVKDINPDGNGFPFALNNFAAINNTFFFSAYTTLSGYELWKTDGTEAGTVMVKDIDPYGDSTPGYLTGFDGKLYFSTDGGLWKSDGTEAGTVMVKDGVAPSDLTNAGKWLYFIAYNNYDTYFSISNLWKTDGTEAGTVLVKAIRKDGWSRPSLLTNLNGELFFTANDGINGEQTLWKSDGTEAGTMMFKNSYTTDLIRVNKLLYFQALGELWKSDGTEAGTKIVKDFGNKGIFGSYTNVFGSFTNVSGELFFLRNTISNNLLFPLAPELWKSDGTWLGTRLVRPRACYLVNPRAALMGGARQLTGANDVLFFTDYSYFDSSPPEFGLWKSNGTRIGTFMLKKFVENPANLTDVNGILFFTGNDGTHGRELWKSDGTWSGTVMVKDINLNGDSYLSLLTDVNGTLYFSAIFGLWKSDGTEAGTVLVKSLIATNLTNVNGTLFFTSDDGIHGLELWKSDGTEAGTFMVKDINPYGDFSPGDFTAINGKLYFSATDGVHGKEPWVSDGTETGTFMIADINPDGSSSPAGFTVADGSVYFSANDGTHGRELWRTTPLK